MKPLFIAEIDAALGADLPAEVTVHDGAPAMLPSVFAVSDLACAAMRAAGTELAACLGAGAIALDRRLTLMWFQTSLRPQGWAVPAAWDAIAGDYRARDGWVRLHTNAAAHRAAALSVLGCAPDRTAVAEAVRDRDREALETAVVAAGGAAAAMHDLAGWAAHPQGRAVAQEPLIAWTDAGPAPARPRTGLRGLRVLDLTRVLAGPVATRFLAGFGAQVLRIDPPAWDEPGIVPEVTPGKRCLGLDLRRAADRARFEALLSGADVLVHGYRPGALEGLGYDAARRRSLAPALIEVTLDAYGWAGPWAGRRGFDSLVQISCGIAEAGMRRTGAARPVPLPVQALDHATGYLMAAAVLRALRRRDRTGQIASARLSLARTAALLTSAGEEEQRTDLAPETAADLAPETEATVWGPARRLRFPIRLPDGSGARWSCPAGPLRAAPPGTGWA